MNSRRFMSNRDRLGARRIILTHLGAEMTDRRGQCEFETADDGLIVKL